MTKKMKKHPWWVCQSKITKIRYYEVVGYSLGLLLFLESAPEKGLGLLLFLELIPDLSLELIPERVKQAGNKSCEKICISKGFFNSSCPEINR